MKESAGTFVLKDNDCTGSQIFEIIKGVDKNRKITHPTTIRDAEMMQYMPDIDESFYDNNRLWPYCEATGIIGGYEALQSKLSYPEEAKKKGVTGNVLLMVWLDEGGAVRGTQLLKSLGYGCDEAAVKAVRQVKFYKHPQGKKNFWIVPVEFAFQPEKSKCDLTCSEFAFQPDMDYRNNNITYVIKNIGKAEVPTREYNIVLYIDGVMASATDYNPQYKPGKEGKFYVKSTPGEGEHEYTLYIDPENVLKEENRANNIIKGKFYGKSIDKRNFIQKFFSKY
ncbi:MAG: TonB family protein [Ignavibacteriales bacterium]|nr:TonB family protein [Ignavibacteriales bacterium]